MKKLTAATLQKGIDHLIEVDDDLARIYAANGVPPLWLRETGFGTLIHIILEQQVSIASAKVAFDKLNALCSPLTPTTFLALDDAALKQAGFSRQKMRYGRILAQAILDGDLDLDVLSNLPDDDVRKELTKLKGIGPWTAEIYLLMALGRVDTWPVGDLALQIAVQDVRGWEARPKSKEMAPIGEPWRPWRGVAARLLWHHYLERRNG